MDVCVTLLTKNGIPTKMQHGEFYVFVKFLFGVNVILHSVGIAPRFGVEVGCGQIETAVVVFDSRLQAIKC